MTSSFSGQTMAGLAAKIGAMAPVPVRFGWGWLGIGAGYLALDAEKFRISGQRGGKQVEIAVPRSAIKAATFKRNRVLLKIDRSAGEGSQITWVDADAKVADRFFAWLPDSVTKDPSIIGRWYETTLGPYRRRAWMSYLLTLIIIGVFIWQGLDANTWRSFPVPKLISQGGNLAPLTLDGEPWRLLTAVFLHGGLDHLIGNLIAFLIVAPYLERLYGRTGLFGLFIAIGIIGSLIDLWLNFRVVCVGASGAIFGMYGALLAYGLRRRGQLPMRSIVTILISGAFFLIWQIKAGFDSVGTNNAVHVTGALSGFFLGLLVAPPLAAPWREFKQLGWAVAVMGIAVGLAAAAMPLARKEDNWKMVVLLEKFFDRYETVRQTCVEQIKQAEESGVATGSSFQSSCLDPISGLREEILALKPADVDLLERQAQIGQGLKTRRELFSDSSARVSSLAQMAEIESAQEQALAACQSVIDQLGNLSIEQILAQFKTDCQQPFTQLQTRVQSLAAADPNFASVAAELNALVKARRDGMEAIAEAIAADDVEAFNLATESIRNANARYSNRGQAGKG